AVALCDLAGRPLDRTALLIELVGSIQRTLQAAASGGEAIARRFAELCQQFGQGLVIDTHQRRLSGRCAGIASDGALLLDTGDGRQKIYSGTVVRPPAIG